MLKVSSGYLNSSDAYRHDNNNNKYNIYPCPSRIEGLCILQTLNFNSPFGLLACFHVL
jgi:hypothetical protein